MDCMEMIIADNGQSVSARLVVTTTEPLAAVLGMNGTTVWMEVNDVQRLHPVAALIALLRAVRAHGGHGRTARSDELMARLACLLAHCICDKRTARGRKREPIAEQTD